MSNAKLIARLLMVRETPTIPAWLKDFFIDGQRVAAPRNAEVSLKEVSAERERVIVAREHLEKIQPDQQAEATLL